MKVVPQPHLAQAASWRFFILCHSVSLSMWLSPIGPNSAPLVVLTPLTFDCPSNSWSEMFWHSCHIFAIPNQTSLLLSNIPPQRRRMPGSLVVPQSKQDLSFQLWPGNSKYGDSALYLAFCVCGIWCLLCITLIVSCVGNKLCHAWIAQVCVNYAYILRIRWALKPFHVTLA